MFILRFINTVAAELNTLFATLVLLPEWGGEVLPADGMHDPLPDLLDGGLGQPALNQLLPVSGKVKKNSLLGPEQANMRNGQPTTCVAQ